MFPGPLTRASHLLEGSNPLASCRDSERVPFGVSDAHSRASGRSGSDSFPPHCGLAHNVVMCAATSCCAGLPLMYHYPMTANALLEVETFASLRPIVSNISRDTGTWVIAVAPPFSHRDHCYFYLVSWTYLRSQAFFWGWVGLYLIPPYPPLGEQTWPWSGFQFLPEILTPRGIGTNLDRMPHGNKLEPTSQGPRRQLSLKRLETSHTSIGFSSSVGNTRGIRACGCTPSAADFATQNQFPTQLRFPTP